MGRKITMTGRHARYEEHRAANATPDNEREIRMEGEEAVYQEYAYGKPGRREERQEPGYGNVDAERVLLTVNPKPAKDTMNEAELLERLRPIFYNNEDDVRQFLREVSGMSDNDITDLVNRWVQEKRISDYGNSRKGTLWTILHDAGLYDKSRQNWNRRVY